MAIKRLMTAGIAIVAIPIGARMSGVRPGAEEEIVVGRSAGETLTMLTTPS